MTTLSSQKFHAFKFHYGDSVSFPSQLNATNEHQKIQKLDVSSFSNTISYLDTTEIALQSKESFRVEQGRYEYYFEVSVNTLDSKGVVAIGFAQQGFSATKQLPGWLPGSVGYHSDDGKFFNENGKGGIDLGSYGSGVIGCGIRENGELYYTKNGQLLNSTNKTFPSGSVLYPTIGLCGPAEVAVNFGSTIFVHSHKIFNKIVESVETVKRFSSQRFSSHIATDKPIYRPGDTVYYRSWILDSHTHTPLQDSLASVLFPANKECGRIKIIGPGETEAFNAVLTKIIDSTIGGAWQIPAEMAGGDYFIRISYNVEGFPAAERKFNVREMSANPRMKLQLQFEKKGYGAGDTAVANITVERSEGGVPEGAKVTSTARLDGKEVYSGTSTVPKDGKLSVSFKLPTSIDVGEGTLTCTVDDSGTVESTGQSIPVLLYFLKVNVYPEGGNIVAGLSNKIYVEAFLPSGEPADFTGEIVSDQDIVVGTIQTVHEGRGSGSFIAHPGRSYNVRVIYPAGIKNLTPIPSPVANGAILSAMRNIYEPEVPLNFQVGSTSPGLFKLKVYKREKEIGSIPVQIRQTNETVETQLYLGDIPDSFGVLRATLYNVSTNLPIAERLVFRKSSHSLKINIETEKPTYSPGQKVKLRVTTTDENGCPVAAVLGICVTDDSILEMVEKRKQVPRLPVMAYFENEVDHLEDSHVYLDPSHPKAEIATDLLLGTQGWRRFCYVDVNKFLDQSGSESSPNNNASGPRAKDTSAAERLLVIHKGLDALPSLASPVSDEPSIDYDLMLESEERVYSESLPVLSYASRSSVVQSVSLSAVPQASSSRMSLPKPAAAPRRNSTQRAEQIMEEPVAMKEMSTSSKKKESKSLFSGFISGLRRKEESRPAAKMRALDYEEDDYVAPSLISPVASGSVGTYVPIRQYAHQSKRTNDNTERSDFTETLFWDAGFAVNPLVPSNLCSVEFSQEGNSAIEVSERGKKLKTLSSSYGWTTAHAVKKVKVDSSTAFSVTWKMDYLVSSTYANIMIGITPQLAHNGQYVGGSGLGYCYYGTMYSSNIAYKYHNGSSGTYGHPFKIGDTVEMKIVGLELRFIHNGEDLGVCYTVTNGEYYVAASFCSTGDIISVSSSSVGRSHNFIEFDTNDSVTSFRVWVDAVGVSSIGSGMLGSHSSLITSTNPFFIDYKLPFETTTGDNIIIPLSLVNNTQKAFDVKLSQKATDKGEILVFSQSDKDGALKNSDVKMSAESRRRANIEALVKISPLQTISVTLSAVSSNGEFKDSVTRDTRVVPFGFPYALYKAGQVEQNSEVSWKFTIPHDVDPQSVKTGLVWMLNPLGSMSKALEALVREPYGCFEQTSSVVYPMVMAQQYFLSHRDCDESIKQKAEKHISAGYARLTGFEVKNALGMRTGGFDWYGAAPANESLTAYGLLEFNDMKQVYPVDKDLIPRVRDWLFSRKDGKGQFLRGSGRYGFGHAPPEITNAYICWSLTESGEQANISKEVEVLIQLGETTKKDDPYFLALLTCTLYNLKRKDEAERFGYRLTELQQEDGSVTGAHDRKLHDTRFTTITYSWGDGLFISSTSLAVFAWLKGGKEFLSFYEKAMKWLSQKCKGGSFGDTQSTILALKAIVEYDKLRSAQIPGSIDVLIDGKSVSQLKFEPKSGSPTLSAPDFADKLTPGEHTIAVKMNQGCTLPFAFAVDYNASKPDNDPDCVVHLSTKLSTVEMVEGQGSEILVSMKNLDEKTGQPMTIAIIGLPGGLEPRHEQLQELVKGGVIDFYEVLGREVAIYLREMGPGQEVKFRIDVVAKIPGKFRGQASRIYLYYTNEAKFWNDPLSVAIAPAQ